SEIFIQIFGSQAVQVHAVTQECSLLEIFGRLRVDHEDQIGKRQSLAEVACGQINGLEVVEHPRQDLTTANRMQELRSQRHRARIDFVEAGLAILPAEKAAAVETIDQLFPAIVVVFEQEVSGHSYSRE